jgi:uncharacterized OB-fold protein
MNGDARAPAGPADPAGPYWAAAARRRLEIQRCAGCGTWIHFPQDACPRCGGADLHFEAVSGRGVIDTYTVVHRSFAPETAGDVPYAAGFIELEEQAGLRVFADVVETDPGAVRIGLPVEVTFTERHQWGLVPSFRPRTGPAEIESKCHEVME